MFFKFNFLTRNQQLKTNKNVGNLIPYLVQRHGYQQNEPVGTFSSSEHHAAPIYAMC